MANPRHETRTDVFSTLGSDADLADLVDLFVAEMPERIARVMELLGKHDWPSLARTAHQLKGAAGSYGFHQVTPLARHLELTLCNQEPESQIEQAALELIDLCHRVRRGSPPA